MTAKQQSMQNKTVVIAADFGGICRFAQECLSLIGMALFTRNEQSQFSATECHRESWSDMHNLGQ
jgi:hypothetical protein